MAGCVEIIHAFYIAKKGDSSGSKQLWNLKNDSPDTICSLNPCFKLFRCALVKKIYLPAGNSGDLSLNIRFPYPNAYTQRHKLNVYQ